MSDKKFESAMYLNRADAEDAVTRLRDLGYSENEISVMMHDDTRAREFAAATGSKAAEGTGAGAVIGGSLGVIVAGAATVAGLTAVVTTGGLAAPFVVGPLAAVLSGLGAGVVAGGLVGGLVGAGIPKEQADDYAKELEQGGILIAVDPRDELLDGTRDVFSSRGRVAETARL
jgi:hypothetical protein